MFAEELLRSTFLEMFGDPVTTPRRWRQAPLADISEVITDGEHATPRRTSEGVLLLSARNVQNGFIDIRDEKVDYIPVEEWERIRKRCAPRSGDVLISCSGTIGRVTVVRETFPFGLVRSVAMVRPRIEVLLPDFLEVLLQTTQMQRVMMASAKQSAQANLFLGPIGRLPVIVPPLSAQTRFAQASEAVRYLRSSIQEATATSNTLFDALAQRAFSGRLEKGYRAEVA